MALLSIPLFGEFPAVDHRGNALSIGNRRTQALIAFLALTMEGERTVKDFAALFVDGDVDVSAALTRDLQFALRFIPPDLLMHDRGSLRLKREVVEVDVVQFNAFAASESLASIRSAADLYAGPLLPGFSSGLEAFDRWLEMARRQHGREVSALFITRLSAPLQ